MAEERSVSVTSPGADQSEKMEDLQRELDRREKALEAAVEERDTLMSELEELDRQNQEATQHMISVKEQLSGQLKEAETQLAKLTTELNAAKDQKQNLEHELNTQKDQMSQSAFTLNDLHMGRQQLEQTVKELKEKVAKSQEQSKEAKKEIAELKLVLQEKDEELSNIKTQLFEAGSKGDKEQMAKEAMAMKENEISALRRQLDEGKNTQEKVLSEDYELKMENRRLKEECSEKTSQIAEINRQIAESQSALNRTIREKETRIEALKLEKGQLEGELQQVEKTLSEQARQYQQTIDELTRARSMDASALQTEHEKAIKINQEKDMVIAQLRRDIEQLASDHRDTNEMLSMTVAGQKQLTDLLQEKDAFVDTLKQNSSELQKELENSIAVVTKEAENLKQALEEKDRQLGGLSLIHI